MLLLFFEVSDKNATLEINFDLGCCEEKDHCSRHKGFMQLLEKSLWKRYTTERITLDSVPLLTVDMHYCWCWLQHQDHWIFIKLSCLHTFLDWSYHSLGSRLWASRHRRGLWGWINCTVQIKPHKRRKQYRWTYRTATWIERQKI